MNARALIRADRDPGAASEKCHRAGTTTPVAPALATSNEPILTIEELLRAYVLAHPELKKRTTKRYRQVLRMLEALGGPWLLSDMQVPQAQQLYDAAATKYTVCSANGLRKCVRASWIWAAQRGRAPQVCPWRSVAAQAEGRRELYFDAGWLPSVMAIVWRLAERGTIKPHAARFIAVLLSSGCRPWCELLRLRCEDVDVAGKVIVFRDSKGGASRSIPLDVLTPQALAGLLAQLEIAEGGGEWLWPALRRDHAGSPMCSKSIVSAWARVRAEMVEVGLCATTLTDDPVVVYDARRAWASYTVGEVGVSVDQTSRLMGHRNPATLIKHYLYLNTSQQVPAAKAFAQAASQAVAEIGGSGCEGASDGGQWGVRPERVKQAREDMPGAVTQSQLAAKLSALGEKVSKQAISQWENGASNPARWVHKLAVVTGKSTDYFFGRAAA